MKNFCFNLQRITFLVLKLFSSNLNRIQVKEQKPFLYMCILGYENRNIGRDLIMGAIGVSGG
jgi:hypothetical protein